ncbi:MAG: gamma carbonic anhydrase family protein [Pseudomonadota bacterium]
MIYSLNRICPEIHDDCFIAPSADIIGSVIVSEKASVWFNATIRGDNDVINIGFGSNVQDNAVLHTDPGLPLTIGQNVTIGHSVVLHGCTIGNGSLIGIGSVVLNHASIGESSLVGARSLVTEGKSFPPRSLILGSPAKAVRELTDDEVEGLAMSANSYQEKSRLYRELSTD